MLQGVTIRKVDGKGLRVAVINTRWNEAVVQAMKTGAINIMTSNGVKRADIIELEVPGAYELPFASQSIIASGKVDAVIALGCLVKGETKHFEYICEAVTQGLTRVGLDTGVPVIFGVLTVLTEEQAAARAGLTPNGHNHGEDYGYAAIEMAKLKHNPKLLSKL